MVAVRFNAQFHPPPGFNKVIEGIKRHGTFKRHGYVKFDDLRSIALASDRTGYSTKSQIAELRNFLVKSATVIEDGSQKYFFDLERAYVVLACCDKQEALPAGINPQQRLKFLKCCRTSKKDDVSSDVNGTSETAEATMDTEMSNTESVQLRWLIRLTIEQAKVLRSVAAGEITTRVSTLLGVWATDPLKQIGLLIKRGERRLSVWECDLVILQQCRFDVFPRENHRGIPIVEEVPDGQTVFSDQWRADLEAIADGRAPEPIVIASTEGNAPIVPEVIPLEPEVRDVDAVTLQHIPTDLIPVQYSLIMSAPESLSSAQLEEAMLAILVLAATLQTKHAAFVAEKKRRVQKEIDDAQAEKARIDEQIEALRLQEQELRNAREAMDAKLASLQQDMPS